MIGYSYKANLLLFVIHCHQFNAHSFQMVNQFFLRIYFLCSCKLPDRVQSKPFFYSILFYWFVNVACADIHLQSSLFIIQSFLFIFNSSLVTSSQSAQSPKNAEWKRKRDRWLWSERLNHLESSESNTISYITRLCWSRQRMRLDVVWLLFCARRLNHTWYRHTMLHTY